MGRKKYVHAGAAPQLVEDKTTDYCTWINVLNTKEVCSLFI